MKGFVENIEKLTLQNKNFRTVLYTAKNCQLVVMSIPVDEEIGAEVHNLDQFLRIEQGEGKAVLDGVSHKIVEGTIILVPQGTEHNIINTGQVPLKLYTLYAPPNHKDKIIHRAKADAEADEDEHFDGQMTE